ncbi:hypothetical protein [Thiohalocapsa halophila]|uniref:hypothetical protein n=1 Tax=Thiohalocapsa halophila TaxID=69359 RepID=UPI001904BB77|nr:hypothetical protein [Thiohalocapsa halophila]
MTQQQKSLAARLIKSRELTGILVADADSVLAVGSEHAVNNAHSNHRRIAVPGQTTGSDKKRPHRFDSDRWITLASEAV